MSKIYGLLKLWIKQRASIANLIGMTSNLDGLQPKSELGLIERGFLTSPAASLGSPARRSLRP